MNKLTKNTLLAGIMILLITACGPVETTPAPVEAPVSIVTENPTDVPITDPAAGLAPEKFRKFIGLNYPPIPEGLTEGFAMLIQDAEDHSLSLVLEGADKMLWLSRMTHRDSSGNAFWEVKDILGLSDLEAGLTLLPDGCSLNGAPDSEIFVAGNNGTILYAWRANTALDVFEVLPIDGIECQSDKGWSLE
jgi:hypothetical protein